MAPQTLLGFDFGTLRIGVSVGNTILGTADPLMVIPAEPVAARWSAIARLVEQWQPQRLVVGRPVHHRDGEHGGEGAAPAPELASRCERFARQLSGRFALPVELVDEGWSSMEAGAAIADRGTRDASGVHDDAEAAAIILRQYLSSNR